MILKKPYAFFIKQFKTIHFIMSLLITFLIYRITLIVAFFNEYLGSATLEVDPTAYDTLFTFYIFLVPFIVISISVLVLWVLFLKKKPFLFYIINIAVYISVLFILSYTSSIVNELIEHAVHLRTVRLARDLLFISIFGQLFTLLKAFVYATGFDIKKFNFGQDLAELEIEEEDNEEFEFEISVDTNKAHRHLRRRARFSRYVYIENKFLINISLLLLTGIIFFIVYFNQNIYNKVYNEKVAFTTQDFTMKVNRSFITKKNLENQEVSRKDMSFVMIEIELKRHGVQKIKLDIARTQLMVDDKVYYHKFGINELASDIGNAYGDTYIPKEFTRYLLIYEVPDKYLEDGKLQYRYLDTFGFEKGTWYPRYVRINLKPRKLDKIVKTNNYNLSDEISFENSILEETTIKLNNFNISRQHKLEYQFCVSSLECYKSYEYIKPDVSNVYDKTIMYINGSITWDKDLAILPITDVYQFMNTFATINYEINGQMKQHAMDLREVKSQKIKKVNNYYIEVSREMEKADKIFIIFNVRDVQYIYQLK